MIRQVSSWGQFWADLAANHKIHFNGVTTPRMPRPGGKSPYYSLWFQITDKGTVYHEATGDTMIDMMRDGLIWWDVYNLQTKTALLSVAFEMIARLMAREHNVADV